VPKASIKADGNIGGIETDGVRIEDSGLFAVAASPLVPEEGHRCQKGHDERCRHAANPSSSGALHPLLLARADRTGTCLVGKNDGRDDSAMEEHPDQRSVTNPMLRNFL
jgi:hypothetical protein